MQKTTCEHVFGTMKRWLGNVPLLRKCKEKVSTDIHLFVSAYDILRLVNLIDFGAVNALLDNALTALKMPEEFVVFYVKNLKSVFKQKIAIFYMFRPFTVQFSYC